MVGEPGPPVPLEAWAGEGETGLGAFLLERGGGGSDRPGRRVLRVRVAGQGWGELVTKSWGEPSARC